MPSLALRLFGTEETVEPPVSLRAGPLQMVLRGGRLLHICCGAAEIWHGVAFVFRDPDWGTHEAVFVHVEVVPAADSFRVELEGHFPVSPRIGLRIDIEGSASGHIGFRAAAVPSADIESNRMGLCVMHPMSAAGARVDVEHIDGRLSRSTLPKLIPAWPPFMLIRALRHEWAEGRWARCEFAGDVFEMEDQRNNADASFKTYSRSNLMPRPYRLSGGVPVEHRAGLSLETPRPAFVAASKSPKVSVRVGAMAGDLPRIGVEVSPREAEAPSVVLPALRKLRPAHLHLSLQQGEAVNWAGIATLLRAADAGLRLDLTIADTSRSSEVLQQLREALSKASLSPESMAIFPSEPRSIRSVRLTFPAAAVGGGTPHFFVQLNRIEELGDVDFLSFTTSSIVHGADDDLVMLGLQSLPSMIKTLRARYPHLPVRVGPSTIAARSSPLGRQPVSDGTRRIALASRDPRCGALYGAAWTLGYAAQFATAGTQALTLMSLCGPAGVMRRQGVDRLARNPAYFVLARLGAPARIHDLSIDDPRKVAALALDRDGRRELLLANLTAEPITVVLSGWRRSGALHMLDAASGARGWRAVTGDSPTAASIRLTAYSVASLTQA